MSGRLAIVVLEDETEVRDALMRDLEPLADRVRIEPCEDVADARTVIEELARDGDVLAVVLADHRLPGTTGVAFLVELHADAATTDVRKVLVTGQADHADTIRAINEAGLDRYVAKPWQAEPLRALVRAELTDFVIGRDLDPLPHLPVLDAERALPLLRDRGDR